MACRENTLPRDEDSSEPKGSIRGNTKSGPALEVTTCCLQGNYGVEIRIKSFSIDSCHSWIRTSRGLNQLFTNLIDKEYDENEQETSETKTEAFALKTDVFAFAIRSKTKAKPRRPTSACSSTSTFHIGERTWTDIEPQKYSLSDYPVSMKLINLLRHGSLPRHNDGAIEFWRINDYLQDHSVLCHHWSDEKWKSRMAGGGGNKKRFQYCYGKNMLDDCVSAIHVSQWWRLETNVGWRTTCRHTVSVATKVWCTSKLSTSSLSLGC